MAVTITPTSNYTEGADRVRRYQIVGDTAYPPGGYDIIAALKLITGPPIVIKRVIGIRNRTVASAAYTPVAVDTYTGGIISGLKVALTSGGTEVAAGTNVSATNIELVTEGY